jgi:hypothetical protein
MAINKNHVDCNYYLGTATLSSVTVAPSVWVKSNAREDERVLVLSLSASQTHLMPRLPSRTALSMDIIHVIADARLTSMTAPQWL